MLLNVLEGELYPYPVVGLILNVVLCKVVTILRLRPCFVQKENPYVLLICYLFEVTEITFEKFSKIGCEFLNVFFEEFILVVAYL